MPDCIFQPVLQNNFSTYFIRQFHEEHEKQQYCVELVLFGNSVFQPALCQTMLEASYSRREVCP